MPPVSTADVAAYGGRMADLDRRKPLWPQIYEDIKGQIERGELAPGDRVPGIHAIMTTYGVTNSTAQKALRALKADGLVETWSGSGTFVRQLDGDG